MIRGSKSISHKFKEKTFFTMDCNACNGSLLMQVGTRGLSLKISKLDCENTVSRKCEYGVLEITRDTKVLSSHKSSTHDLRLLYRL